jgi:hypothetical protein
MGCSAVNIELRTIAKSLDKPLPHRYDRMMLSEQNYAAMVGGVIPQQALGSGGAS